MFARRVLYLVIIVTKLEIACVTSCTVTSTTCYLMRIEVLYVFAFVRSLALHVEAVDLINLCCQSRQSSSISLARSDSRPTASSKISQTYKYSFPFLYCILL